METYGDTPEVFCLIGFRVITIGVGHVLGENSESYHWDIRCQLTPFSVFFCQPSLILLKFGMFVDLDEKMSHTKFQVSKLNSF